MKLFDEWILRNGKEEFIKLLNNSIMGKEIYNVVGYNNPPRGKIIDNLEKLCKKYDIKYDLENWKKLRYYKNNNAPKNPPPKYCVLYIKYGKDEIINLLNNTRTKRNLYRKIYGKEVVGGHVPGRTPFWDNFKEYCLQFFEYDFTKWEKQNKINSRGGDKGLKYIKEYNNIIHEHGHLELKYILFSFHSQKRLAGSTLKRQLLEVGLEYKCVGPICIKGNGEINIWLEHPNFGLEVEHIDGNHNNNTYIFDIEKQRKINPNIGKTNLCFLCPGCHTIMTNIKKERDALNRKLMKKEDINVLQLNTSL